VIRSERANEKDERLLVEQLFNSDIIKVVSGTHGLNQAISINIRKFGVCITITTRYFIPMYSITLRCKKWGLARYFGGCDCRFLFDRKGHGQKSSIFPHAGNDIK
jgi:hypothetical protein